MLRELRSCVTLLRELRIVNESYAQWALRSFRQTSQNENIVFDLHDLLKHYVQYEPLEEGTADSGCSGPRGGQ
jgi:hypothetical protein